MCQRACGKTIGLRFERFASLAVPHVLVLCCQITPIDFHGTITVQSSLNGYPAQLGLAPIRCVVVEDAAVGIEAAIAAKMWTIGLSPVNRFGSAHIVLPTLMGVHLADLQTKLGKYLDN